MATVGGIGLLPGAPGTAGSLVGVALWWVTTLLPAPVTVWVQAGLLAVILAVGVWSSARVEKASGKCDPPQIVIDEVAGMLITFLAAPFSWPVAVAGFVLFRFFDIVKPFPINRLQRLKGGWGVMADDVAAGVASALLLRVAMFILRTL